jgi:leucyl-tRNA synthetase
VTVDIEALRYNTAIARLMELVSGLESAECRSLPAVKALVQMVAPFGPFIAQELWSRLGGEGMVFDQAWPVYDPDRIQQSTFEMAVQVNGRLRATVRVPVGIAQNDAERTARGDARIRERLGTVQRVVFVPGKLINFVTGE